MVLENTLEGPLDSKETKLVNPKENQPWIFIRRTYAEAPIFWPPDVKSWLIGKDPDAGKDWGEEEKGTTEDEMVGWYHQLNGHEFDHTLGDGERTGKLGMLQYGVAKSWIRLCDWTTVNLHWKSVTKKLEKEVRQLVWGRKKDAQLLEAAKKGNKEPQAD